MKTTTIVSVAAIVLSLVAFGATFIKTNDTPGEFPVELGSASSPSVVGNCMEVNGVTNCFYSQRMANASTTCSFKPAATSTLVAFGAKITNSYSGSYGVELAKSATAYSTTTRLGYEATGIAAGNQNTIVASSSLGAAQVFGPNDFANVKFGSSSPTVQGTCSAVFQVI